MSNASTPRDPIPDERLVDTARRLGERLEPADLDATLRQITAAAVEVLPNVQFSSITIRHADGRLDTIAPTDERLLRIDGEQYRLQEGPCYEAAVEKNLIVSSDLGADESSPKSGQMAVREGGRAQIGLRLFDARRSNGALN